MRNKPPILGIDLLGGNQYSFEYVLATLQCLYTIEAPFQLVLFVEHDIIFDLKKELKFLQRTSDKQCDLFAVKEVIHMHDHPLHVVRKKKDSSMCLGIRLLKKKKINALISTGNTGALIAAAKMQLSMIKNISTLALMALLPTKRELVAVIDVGANIYCTSQQLMQFAQMGVAYQKSRGIKTPSIGLLNIGREKRKGREEFKETYKRLLNCPEFVGNVEGKEVFSGDVHVLVADGFAGNIFLKTSEGIASFILDIVSHSSKHLLKKLETHLYPIECCGAIVCGVDEMIMKCHANSTPEIVKHSVQRAIHLVQHSFIEKIQHYSVWTL